MYSLNETKSNIQQVFNSSALSDKIFQEEKKQNSGLPALLKVFESFFNELRRSNMEYVKKCVVHSKTEKPCLSQRTACDGNYYQIPAKGDNANPPPGALPL